MKSLTLYTGGVGLFVGIKNMEKNNNTIRFLRKSEWEMGNGQCDRCCGNEPGGWAPHPCVPTKEYEGHEIECPLAIALEELGEKVQYKTIGFQPDNVTK